jgi:hypothetical protein
MQTIYYVQGFKAGEGGLRPGQLMWRGSEDEARYAARLIADRYDGVLAWGQAGDYELGEYAEPVILLREGLVPDLAEAA